VFITGTKGVYWTVRTETSYTFLSNLRIQMRVEQFEPKFQQYSVSVFIQTLLLAEGKRKKHGNLRKSGSFG